METKKLKGEYVLIKVSGTKGGKKRGRPRKTSKRKKTVKKAGRPRKRGRPRKK